MKLLLYIQLVNCKIVFTTLNFFLCTLTALLFCTFVEITFQMIFFHFWLSLPCILFFTLLNPVRTVVLPRRCHQALGSNET